MRLNLFANELDVKRLQAYVDDPEDVAAQHTVRLGITVVDEVDGEEETIGWTELYLQGNKAGLMLYFHASVDHSEDLDLGFLHNLHQVPKEP